MSYYPVTESNTNLSASGLRKRQSENLNGIIIKIELRVFFIGLICVINTLPSKFVNPHHPWKLLPLFSFSSNSSLCSWLFFFLSFLFLSSLDLY